MTFKRQWLEMTPIDIWPRNIYRKSQADQYVWVLRSCHVTWWSYSIFNENNLLIPLTPNDLRLTFDPIKSQKDLKLINMYKS